MAKLHNFGRAAGVLLVALTISIEASAQAVSKDNPRARF